MAIIVVSILMIALSPVIVLSVATRVQSKRVESATQAAQSYIDALRSETIDPPYVSNLPSLSGVSAPSEPTFPCPANSYCSTPPTSTDALYCVDGDQEGCESGNPKDMLIQSYGRNQLDPSTVTDNEERADQGYQLGIRVYRADAFSGSEPLRPTSQDISNNERVTQSPATGGLGDRKAPLLEITTEIVTEDTGYSDFRERLQ